MRASSRWDAAAHPGEDTAVPPLTRAEASGGRRAASSSG